VLSVAPIVTAVFVATAPVPHEKESVPVAPGRPGTLLPVPARSRAAAGAEAARPFVVQVEGGLRVDRRAFARRVESILSDRRGWRRHGYTFRRVSAESIVLRVVLASPVLTNRLCYPLLTNGIFSCYQAGRAVLNFLRWRTGAATYGRDLRRYRVYMVNHEVGHALGYGHVWCPRAGERAPIMMQQTKNVSPCVAWPWP
jgi:hypothetical protein